MVRSEKELIAFECGYIHTGTSTIEQAAESNNVRHGQLGLYCCASCFQPVPARTAWHDVQTAFDIDTMTRQRLDGR